MTDSIFQAGKEYLTRDGRRARVYATDGGGNQPIQGAIQFDDGWYGAVWFSSGNFYSGGGYDPSDLMPPEAERETIWLYCYRCADGTGVNQMREFLVKPDGALKLLR